MLESIAKNEDESASSEEEFHRQVAIKGATLEVGNKTDKCLDCSEIIPALRREFIPGCKRCLKCQAEWDALTANQKARRELQYEIEIPEKDEEEEEIKPIFSTPLGLPRNN